MPEIVTAAMLVIGDEILSGRTKDRNIGHLAEIMTAIGIDLKEVRIVPDEEDEIVAAVNAVRARYTYVFTTGGIGPTHDDITADSMARAFGVPCEYDARAYALLEESYARRGIEFTEARKRMARMPRGAAHIDNPISTAPGFRIGNVHVMAGVPAIFQAMLDNVVPTLKGGTRMLSAAVLSTQATNRRPAISSQRDGPAVGAYRVKPGATRGSSWSATDRGSSPM